MKRVATHTPGALSHDFGGHTRHTKPISVIERCNAPTPYTDDTGRTACHWPARWRSVALEILSLLSRELPPGSWVEWSEYDGDDVTWFCATADDRHFWRFESRWAGRGNSDLDRSALRRLGRLVPGGSDPDPTSRGPITGGGS